jgi:hypothetical protein
MFVNATVSWCATATVFVGPTVTGVDERGSSTLWGAFQSVNRENR